MHLPVVISQVNGHFAAEVLGVTELRAEGATRETAIQSLRNAIQRRIGGAELIDLPIDDKSMHPFFGAFKDDPTLKDIREEAYRLRDEQRIAEHGERGGAQAVAGIWKDDPTLEEMIADIFRERDAQRDAEFVHPKGLHPIIGRYMDDPTLADLRADIYHERDAQRIAEFGE